MNKSGASYIIIAALAALAAWWFLSHEIRTVQTTRIDTVVTQAPPLVIHAKAKVRYIHDTAWVQRIDTVTGRTVDSAIILDTTYSTRPFVATLDTVIDNDTASLMFRYPSMMFAMELKRHPDTTTRTTVTEQQQPAPRSMWDDVPIALGGFIIGFLVGGR